MLPEGWCRPDPTWKQHYFEKGHHSSLCGLVFRWPLSSRQRSDSDDICAHCAKAISSGRDKSDKCPSCGQPAYLLTSADRFFHLDGSDNRRCWLRISRGEDSS